MITTIVLPVSRPDFLHRIFAQLDMMPCKREQTNLLVYVDGDMSLFEKARNFVVNSKFRDKLCVYRKKGLPSVNHIKSRRRRIGQIHNEIKAIINHCDYVFLLEDDTLFPLDTLKKLLKNYAIHPYAGFITGVQIGRWGYTVPGLWKCDNPYNVKQIESCLPKDGETRGIYTQWAGVEEIDAAGLYCCITKLENYKKGDFEPFDEILGPDVSFGLSMRREGFKNYVDWSLGTSHLTKHGEIKLSNTTLQKITFKKREDGGWDQEVV